MYALAEVRAASPAGVHWTAGSITNQLSAVVYEINTNPMVRGVRREFSSIRDEAFAIGRERLAELLWQVDSGDGGRVTIPRTERLEQYRRRNLWRLSPKRP